MKKTLKHLRQNLRTILIWTLLIGGFYYLAKNFIVMNEIFIWLNKIFMQLVNLDVDVDGKKSNPLLDTQVSAITNAVSFVIAVLGLWLFYRRIRNQDKQIKLQIDQRVDERFTTAVSLLGSSESSARTGAIYALYHLAVDDDKDKKYRRQIAQILCSHIRSKTQEGDYRGKLKEDNHKERPSNEIQTCIDLLFKPKPKSEGLYTKYASDLDKADLSHAYLVGADFVLVQCQSADFSNTQCQSANFIGAQCQGAYFYDIHCQGANFFGAQCQGANFMSAQCQGANFFEAQFQGADFFGAQCQGADFSAAKCQGADFYSTDLKGAHALADRDWRSLESRVTQDTELENMVFAGPLNDGAIKAIKTAKEHINSGAYKALKKIIKDNKNEEINCMNVPKGIITGVLEDSEEMQAIIAEDWDKLEDLQKKARKR